MYVFVFVNIILYVLCMYVLVFTNSMHQCIMYVVLFILLCIY